MSSWPDGVEGNGASPGANKGIKNLRKALQVRLLDLFSEAAETTNLLGTRIKGTAIIVKGKIR